MGALELILLATLPLVLLVGLFDGKDDDDGAGAPETPEDGEAPAAGGNLLDFLDAAEPAGPDPGPPALSEAPGHAPPAAPPPQAQQDPGHDGPAPVPPEFGRYAARGPILGSGDSDTLTGTDDADVIFANGLDGRSTAGNLLSGGQGDDTLLGGRGPDRLVGGEGDNLIHASYGPEMEIAQGSDLFAWRDNGLPDTLEGGPGDDRLILARGDIASGGGGSNAFEVWHDPGSAQPVAVITDFDPGADRLDVVVRIDETAHPGCDGWAFDRSVRASVFETARVELRPAADGGATEVLVEGEPVARLLGPPPPGAEAVRVFAFWDIVS